MSACSHRCLACVLLVFTLVCFGACQASTGLRGKLLLIGGGLDDDSASVYRRFLELASLTGTPRVVIATAATGPQDVEATDKTEALRTWRSDVRIEVVRRETPTAATVAAIDAASGIFFTGGDQKRITDRYRPGDQPTPEWLAMQRLLARGGVIAGASAGDAMMGNVMFLGGGSARSLGIAPAATPAGEEPARLGPQIGPGMKFLPWALTESHFFERDRVGRLVAGLEASGQRLGIAVGEDAAVEVDLATGELIGITESESLLVDAAHQQRDGRSRLRNVGRIIAQGDRVSLLQRLRDTGLPPLPAPAGAVASEVPIVEPGQNRQLASWRMFRAACTQPVGTVWRLQLEDWSVVTWPAGDGSGEAVFDVLVAADRPGK